MTNRVVFFQRTMEPGMWRDLTLRGMTGTRDRVEVIARQISRLSEQTGQMRMPSSLP